MLYELNLGSICNKYFQAFANENEALSVGVQLSVVDSDLDFFTKIRDFLLSHSGWNDSYNELKRRFEGKSNKLYRVAKGHFFDEMMGTEEFRANRDRLNSL